MWRDFATVVRENLIVPASLSLALFSKSSSEELSTVCPYALILQEFLQRIFCLAMIVPEVDEAGQETGENV
ncbi:unnamed protein product, partial [Amoebophrya sp. A25]|eukprot:GSA25T00003512001.1